MSIETVHKDDAVAADNANHVGVVIHSCRSRLGLADGEGEYAELEQRLAEAPAIRVRAVTLGRAANDAPHPDPSAYAGKYGHRAIEGDFGHNLPQEAPGAFAEAVFEVAERER